MLPGTWLAGATSPAEAARISWINRPGPQADPARGGTSGYYPFGPAPGVAAMTVLVSHVGTCHLGVNVDIDAVREPELFDACLHQGFAMVLGLARAWPTSDGRQRGSQ